MAGSQDVCVSECVWGGGVYVSMHGWWVGVRTVVERNSSEWGNSKRMNDNSNRLAVKQTVLICLMSDKCGRL